tara:strand:- start:2289 stop:2963 length:675 start_codon:yes stop_codon:yes gene_type:complete
MRRKRQRILPNPRTIKKHSDIVRQYAPELIVVGEREKTDTGYRVRGYSGKGFETFYEVMLPGTCTPVVKHGAKSRVIRILAGSGVVKLSVACDEPYQRSVLPGDEIHFSPGTKYQISTKSKDTLEYCVTQDAKYESRLKEVSPGIGTVVPESELQAVTTRTYSQQGRRSRASTQKARTQLAAMRASRKVKTVAVATDAVVKEASAAEGVNLRPTGGRFSTEGAG